MTEDKGSLLKDLAKLIPGYGAYVDQESRRHDDRLAREFLKERLGDCKDKLNRYAKKALSAGDFELPAKLEPIHSELDRAQTRLMAAVEGYAGWFGHRDVDASVLKEALDVDQNMVSLVDQIDAIVQKAIEGAELSFDELTEAAERLHSRIDRRNQIIESGS